MSRTVLSSLLLLTTLLQSTQPCCAHSWESQRGCCGVGAALCGGAHEESGSCHLEATATDTLAGNCRSSCTASHPLTLDSTLGKEPSHHFPNPEHRECPACKGELPNPMTKAGELPFDLSTDQETTDYCFPVISLHPPGTNGTPNRGDRSRIRSPGHLLI